MMASTLARVIGHHRSRARPAKCSPRWRPGRGRPASPCAGKAKGGSGRVVASVSGGCWCARVFLLGPRKCGGR